MTITILRLGHRPDRDKRITTHVALTARAFGADSIIITTSDEVLEQTVKKVVKRFGGPFNIATGVPWRKTLNEFSGQVVHLTMYGEQVDEAALRIDPQKDVMIVVGATKVPRAVYDRADFNVSVGNQPHSEVAALAIFLDRLTHSKGLTKEFSDYEIKILPDPQGKIVVPSDWVPDREECLGLLEENGVPENVLDHILAVTKLAMAAGERLVEMGKEVDLETLLAGSLLHDIGRAQTHDIFHAIEGESLLDGYGISPEILGIVRNHIGAGLTAAEADELGLPPGDYVPVTLEEKILTAADNLFDGDKRIPLVDELAHLNDKGLPQVAEKVEMLHKEMSKVLGMDLDDLEC